MTKKIAFIGKSIPRKRKKENKKPKTSRVEITKLILGRTLTEMMFREAFGISPARLIYRLYGKKWEEEGLKFDFENEKMFDKIYKKLKKKYK